MPTLYQLKSNYKVDGKTYELTTYGRGKNSAFDKARKNAIGYSYNLRYKKMKLSKEAYDYLINVVNCRLEKG